MKNTLETRLGLFFALALIAGVVLLEMIGTPDFFKSGDIVKARFATIQELKVGDPVKMAGVEIGRVRGIHLGDGKVEVDLKLHRGARVKTDSKASIKFIGLMGQNYVNVDFGTPNAPLVAPDAVLETVEQADLNTLMVKLEGVASGVEGLTKNFSGENFSNLLGPFTDFLKENSPRLTAILGNLQVISSQIAKGEGSVGKLINDDTFYNKAVSAVDNLNKSTSDLKPLFEDARLTLGEAKKTMVGINQGEGSLGKLLHDESLYTQTASAMTNLNQILVKINQGQGSVGKLVNDEAFFNNAKMTLQKVEKATEGLEDSGPLSVLGIAVNSLF
jgi:phospholipid/cholesterol/gamma-HCH transport system substrate-binding protein